MKFPSLSFKKFDRSVLIFSLKIVTILVASLAVFYQDLAIIVVDALQSEFMSYTLAIPFIFTYLVYRKRKMIKAAISFESPGSQNNMPYLSQIIGALLFIIYFLLYTGGSYTFMPLEYHMFALPIFAAACIVILFNLRTLRQLAFPIAFLLFLAPPPSDIINILGRTLSETSSGYACAILNLFGFAANISLEAEFPLIVVQTNGTPLKFMVDPACSGLYSLFGFLIFATFIVYIARGNSWKRAATFLLGFPLIYFLNILRITVIVVLGYYYGMGLAMYVFHLMGGWMLILLGTFLVLLVSEKLLKIQLFAKKNIAPCPQCNVVSDFRHTFCQACGSLIRHVGGQFKKGDIAKVSAIAISVILITSVQTPVFALTKGPADILTQIAKYPDPHAPEVEAVALKLLPQNITTGYTNYTLRYEGIDREFAVYAKQDAALNYVYFPSNGSYTNVIFVGIEIASARSCLHRMHVCAYLPHDTKQILLVENPPIIAVYYPFEYKGTHLPVLEWFERTTFSTNSTFQQKHVKFDLCMYPSETESLEEVEDRLRTLGVAIAKYWQPITLWSPIALLISQNGMRLTIIPTVTLGLILGLNITLRKRRRDSNKKAYKKLPTQDQQIVEATQLTQRRTIPIPNNIKSTYQELSGKTIKTQELIQRLDSMEKLGLTKEEIVSQQDEPTLIWKAEI